MKAQTLSIDRISAAALAALGALNALFALSFFAVLAFAVQAAPAQSAEACTGKNLLEAMRQNDPGLLREIEAEAANVVNGDTTLFRVENDKGVPSWLFGTMHLTDKRVIDLPPHAREAFKAASTVAIESVEILDPAKAQLALFSRPELTMFTDGNRLSDYLTAEQREILRDGLSARGIQLALVDRMKPWLITGMVALPRCELDRKKAGESFLDLKLAEDAERDGKSLVGLETLVEQFDAMASLPIEFHVRGLVDTITLGETVDDVLETMTELYVDGKTGTIWPLLRAMTPEIDDAGDAGKKVAQGYAAFEEALVNVRNRTMVDRSRDLVERGGAFIAVGALHLPGEKGLPALFEQDGFTVTPVYN
ncbi:TraB/GumN family protein [Oricola cellulosilytica]|uniref:Polysaccharide biosynthesis protein GumN n=1 Tax=Oricola cellulosilytica TaxID=1429082 RepID=A0A4R0PH56_9HYPH|nr:TraB/GumN family protein [Oricola cellulosilytica]TCD15930.1 polysaccharide biosynthesis protein GumN [Oricola cellulosilytica]